MGGFKDGDLGVKCGGDEHLWMDGGGAGFTIVSKQTDKSNRFLTSV